MMKRYGVGAFGLVVGSLLAGACSSESTPVSPDGGGTDSGSDAPPPCNPRLDPRCLDDNKGFFVKQGALNGDGTRAKPLGSIQDAVAKATGERNQIFVCGPTYTEAVRVEKNVNLYGGFVCDAWTAGTTPTKVSAPKDKYALEVAAGTVDLADFLWESAGYTDADAPLPDGSGHSSIAAFLHGNSKVTAARTKFAAGAGGKGKDADDDATAATNGTAAQDGAMGGKGATSTCGVAGGDGGVVGVTDSTSGKPGPVNPSDDGDTFGKRGCGKGALKDKCIFVSATMCGPGGDGKTGAKGDGASPVQAYGTAADGGWTPAHAAEGKAGGPGGGGGGGGRGDLLGETGGGGGAGGCGGKGGSAGGGGGASIAVLIKDATFACDEACAAASIKGGSGGRGGKGQAGGAGGARGASATACTGGFGAGGSGGQGGQGGSAGLAAGVVFAGASSVRWAGNAVAADASTLPSVEPGESGSPGAGATDGGSGGAGGNGSTSGPIAGEAGAGGAAGFSEPGKKYAAKKL